jgi:hypothetical protein
MNNLVELIRIDGTQARCNIWFQEADSGFPFFRIAWGAAGWGPWIGWN